MTPAIGAPGSHHAEVDRWLRIAVAEVQKHQLDLRDSIVLTEAGSGVFATTPIIAALAGAPEVRAITRDSAWGSASEIRDVVQRVAMAAGVADRVSVTTDRDAAFEGAQLVTNLGFVRPIDWAAVAKLDASSVISLMCEAWEQRPGDVDLEACRARDVVVLATNEHDPSCDCFRYSGPLAGLLLLEAGFALLDVRVVVVGGDVFAPTIMAWLERAGCRVTQVTPGEEVDPARLRDADVFLICDYASDRLVVGNGAGLDPAAMAHLAPGATVVQFAGAIDAAAIARAGLPVWPSQPVAARRMVKTFGALGPAPVIQLHAAGLKVGQVGRAARRRSSTAAEAVRLACEMSALVQPVTP